MTATTLQRDELGRLYVRSTRGARLGWHDLRTGTTHLVDPGAGADVTAAVSRHVAEMSPLRRRRVVTGLVGPQRGPSRPEQVAGAPGLDLRENVPAELATRELLRRLDQARTVPANDPLSHPTRRWYLSALGQRHLGRLLADLPAGWHVLHSLPLAGGGPDLHHLLLGPAGVIVVRTVHEPAARLRCQGRRVRVSGRPADHLRVLGRQVDEVAARLQVASGLPLPVRAVLAVVGPRSIEVLDRPRGTTVLDADDLHRWARERPTVLSSVLADRLVRLAADPGTWAAEDATRPVHTDVLDRAARDGRRAEENDRVELLRHQVRRAARVRTVRLEGIGLALTTVATTAFVVALAPLLPGIHHPAVQQVLAALP